MKKQSATETTKGWLVSSTPWPGCPVIFNLVIITDNNDKAVGAFKRFFNKEDLEITAMFPVEIIDEDTKLSTIN